MTPRESANTLRARNAAAGALAGGVVHEVANLLTVVDGLRQLRSAGGSNEDLRLLDAPAARCQELVECWRLVFGRRLPEPVPAEPELRALARLLETHLRGRRTVVAVAAHDAVLDAALLVHGIPVLACAVLAMLERARRAGVDAERLELRALAAPEGTSLEAHGRGLSLDGAAADWPAPLEEAARALAEEVSLGLGTTASAGQGAGLTVRVSSRGRAAGI
jgi:hypothetical protein